MKSEMRPTERSRSLADWFLLPGQLYMLLLVVLPLLIVAVYSFLQRGTYGGAGLPFTTEAYGRVADPLYLQIGWRSLWVAAAAMAACLAIAFPIAFYIARYARRKTLLLNLVALPFWTSFLIKIYAWMFLLRDTGLVNITLQASGVTRAPLPLLFNTGAVILGLVYGYLPFMIFPIYATLEKLDFALLDAAEDLGASPWTAAWQVAVPLARPGVIAGCVLVFIPALGAYLVPDLMGGGKSVMLGNLVQNQFTTARDWPFGSAIAVCFLLLALGASVALRKRAEELL
jgi:spermidine/putrescine transport system permease protein